jgi:hypothetical protein
MNWGLYWEFHIKAYGERPENLNVIWRENVILYRGMLHRGFTVYGYKEESFIQKLHV